MQGAKCKKDKKMNFYLLKFAYMQKKQYICRLIRNNESKTKK